MTGNAIRVITPYSYSGTWVFDDPDVELVREPFIEGVPAMIDDLVTNIPDAREGFRLTFSEIPFPGYQRELVRLNEEAGGFWYRSLEPELEGWLCPALFKYFDQALEKLYVRADPLE
jgi:hypothetical protein